MFKKLAKAFCGMFYASVVAGFGPIVLAFALLALNALFGVPIDFMTAENPIISDILYPIMTTGLLSILPLFFLMLSAIEVDNTLTIREKGKELAANHTAEELLQLYKQTQDRKKLVTSRCENLYLAKSIAKKAPSNTAIIFDAKTLLPAVDGAILLEGAEEVADRLAPTNPEQKYAIIPVTALTNNFKAIIERECDESWRLRCEMEYLECALALKSTMLTEISVEMTDMPIMDITIPDSTTTSATDPDSNLLMQTS